MSVTLKKRDTISLAKTAGATLKSIDVGLGWDAARPNGFLGKLFGSASGGEIDLDASCVLLDNRRQPVDIVWFQQLASNCGSIKHSGDNRTGDGDGDDETISIALNKLDSRITSLVILINSFTGQSFTSVENAYCRIVNTDSNKELARINLTDQGNHTGLIMGYFIRNNDDWAFTAVGEVCGGRSVQDLLSQAASVVPA